MKLFIRFVHLVPTSIVLYHRCVPCIICSYDLKVSDSNTYFEVHDLAHFLSYMEVDYKLYLKTIIVALLYTMYFCETLWNSTCSPIFMPENTYEKNIPRFPACDIDVQWWNFPGSTFHRMYKVRPIIVREDTSRIAEYFHYYLHIL